MKEKFSKEQKQELIKRYFNGESASTLCLKEGIARSTFYTWLEPYKENPTKKALNISASDYVKLKQRCQKLENIIDILKQVDCTVSSLTKVKLIELEKLYDKYAVRELCAALDVPRATLYNHILRNKKDNTIYQKRRDELSKFIKDIFDESHQLYGANKIHAILRIRSVRTSVRMVAELMQTMGLSSTRNRTKKQYSKIKRKSRKDSLKLNFKATTPNSVWVSDITYFKFNDTTRYICVIIDLFSRKVIAYRISKTQSTHLVTSTFKEA